MNGQAHQRPPGDKGKDGGAVKSDSVASPAAAVVGQLAGMSIAEEASPDGAANCNTNTSATPASPAHTPHEKDAAAVASPAM